MRAITVDADLIVESSGFRIRIDGSGNVLRCRFDSDAASAVRTLRGSRHLLPALRSVIPLLLRVGIRLEFLAGNVRVGRIGAGVKQNALGRLLRLPNAHIGS